MLLSDFNYDLPMELIAKYPSERRDNSRLMVVHMDDDAIEHRHFYDIIEYLRAGDCLVINDSKVMKARLRGTKSTGAAVELLLIRRLEFDIWEAMVRPGRKLRRGDMVVFEGFCAEIADYGENGTRYVRFHYDGDFMELLDRVGEMPIPPYMNRGAELIDDTRYQTVYSNEWGSVAAPTAGLHFTEELLAGAERSGVSIARVTLHVGPGTFLPVKVEDVDKHRMHFEEYSITRDNAELINGCKAGGGRIVCVGTTSVRTLESAAVRVPENAAAKAGSDLRECAAGRDMVQSGSKQMSQPEPETLFDGRYEVKAGQGRTDIFIKPGYAFKMVDKLITNFHLPGSTLLMLVSALYDRERMLNVYGTAISEGYRFFSYGDAMLLL